MAGNLKGIVIEIGGDTTKLGEAINQANAKTKALQSELKGVNSLLKLDPSNVTLLAQKQDILNKAINETRNKLKTLEDAQVQVQEQFDKGEITEEQYRNFQREIEATKQKLKGLETEAKQFGSVMTAQLIATGEKMQAVGGKITGVGQKLRGLSMISAAALGGAVTSAAKFEDAMAKVGTIADKNEVPIKKLSKNVLELSNDTGKAATEISEAMYQALSASVETAEVTGFVENAINLAKAGFLETNDAVDVLTTTLNAYNISAKETEHISDVLVTTQNLGKTTVRELAETMGRVIPTAKQQNVSIEQLAAGYIELTKRGINTANATTYLNSMYTELGKSGTKVSEVLKNKTGKSFDELMESGMSTADALDILNGYCDETGTKFVDLWGKTNSSKAAFTLAGDGADEFNKSLDAVNKSAGTTSKAIEDLTTPAGKARKALNSLKNIGTELGTAFLSSLAPALEDLKKWTKQGFENFSKMDEGMKKNIATTLAVVAVMSPLIIVIGKTITGLGILLSTIGKIGNLILGAPATIQKIALIATSVMTSIQTGCTALWAAIAANPIAAIVIGISALATGLLIFSANSNEATTEAQRLNGELRKVNTRMSEYEEKMKGLAKTRKKTIADGVGELNYYQSLSSELGTIVDKNGKVKKGYEARAEFITTTLAQALGIEIQYADGIVKGYDGIAKAIEKTIEQKKAEIILGAYEEEFKAAIEQRKTMMDDLTTKYEYMARKQKEMDEYLAKGGKKSGTYYETLKTTINNAEVSYNNYAKKVKKNSKEITNYEKMSSDVQQGNFSKVINATGKLGDAYVDTTQMTKKELQKQRIAVKKDLDAISYYNKDNADKDTKARQKELRKQLDDLDNTLGGMESKVKNNKSVPNAHKTLAENARKKFGSISWWDPGRNVCTGIAQSLEENSWLTNNAAFKLGVNALAEFNRSIDSHSPARKFIKAAKTIPQGVEIGVEEDKDRALNAVKRLGADMVEGYKVEQHINAMTTINGRTLFNGIDVSNASLATKMDAMLNVLEKYLPNMKNDIYLDKRILVGEMIGDTDTQLGMRAIYKARGM